MRSEDIDQIIAKLVSRIPDLSRRHWRRNEAYRIAVGRCDILI
ncbi:hypothetical protein MANES_11G047633v8 [Manihot esculenta]|uniref:Uncharacterized protein n=1 Tax=Manihot esculenta TaxID=3983 RepID=A0ACB7GT25_MANES|nr:hypothetical protein MANES_11G047633v8 [Manihot esculenta]